MIIIGTHTTGIVLQTPATDNPATVASGAYVSIGGGGYNRAIYGRAGVAWTVANYGTVKGAGAQSTGIGLASGGTVTNGSAGVTSALISGSQNGVAIEGAAGAVANFATIASTSHGIGGGVHIAHGGTLKNGAPGSTAATISAYRFGIYIGGSNGSHYAGATGTVTNYGVIASTGSSQSAIVFVAGGTVANAQNGTIGGSTGVFITGGTGIVGNSGTIQSTGTAGGNAVYLGQGGNVANLAGGLITSYRDAIAAANVAATITNYGTIAHLGVGTSGEAIYLGAGGLVANNKLISGARVGAPGTVAPAGYSGVVEAGTATAAVTVVNFGTIINPNNSNGVNLLGGGLLINGAPTITSALITAPHSAVYIGGRLGVPTPGGIGTVVNYGTIQNSTSLGPGVELVSGGTVTNRGLIASGRTGVSFHNTAGTLDNFGTIVSTAPTTFTRGVGAYLQNGGLIANETGALISALRSGVVLGIALTGYGTTTQSATLVNAGTIVGSAGITVGAYDTAGNVIVNSGTIIGTAGTAIALRGSENQITLDPGSVISGNIDGGGGGFNIFELAAGAGTGTFAAPAQLTNFTSGNLIEIDAGATWVVSGTGTLAAGFATVDSGTLTYTGDVSTAGSLLVQQGGVVRNADIETGATEVVAPGGLDISATIDGGAQVVLGTASGTTLENGGIQLVGQLVGGQGGFEDAVAVGTTITAGGTEIIASGGTAGGATIAGGLLDLQTGAAATGTIAFAGPGGGLEIDGTTMPTAPIAGFQAGDTVDLRALAFAPGVVSATINNGVLSVTSGGTLVDQLTLNGVSNGTQFTVTSDGLGGTAIGRVKPKLAYMTGATDPWSIAPSDPGSPDSAMNTAFGVGNWTKFQGFTGVALTAGYQFIYLDGGDGDSAQFDTFINTYRSALQSFVAGGGTLFVNAARWLSGAGAAAPADANLNLGFGGVTLDGGKYSSIDTALQPTNPIFNGPNGATGTSWSGNFASHDIVVGNGVNALISGSFGVTLAGEHYGAGYVMFGGMTSPFFQSPQPQADILRANILDYVEGGGTIGAPGVPPPTNLALSPASESGVAGSNDTNVTTPVITGSGVAGDTVTVSDGATAVGTGTVQANGTWAVTTSALADGVHSITATEADATGNVSSASAALSLTIDTSAPVATLASLSVGANAKATPIGIAAPTDANDAASTLTVTVVTLPTNGTVTLADGVTPVTGGEQLTVAQLTGLDFVPGGTGGTKSNFVYDVTDKAGNSGIGAATLATTGSNLFQFVFVYNDGRDTFQGTVADDGTFGYSVGQAIHTSAGQYSIVGTTGATGESTGTVFVTNYTHNGPGEASTTPVDIAAGLPDSTSGLLNVNDAVLGTDGLQHPFSPTNEASFTTNSLFGFVFSYSDGREFYTGTVATAPGASPAIPASPIGTYTVFAEGSTGRAAGTVVVDRFIAGSTALIPNRSGAAGATDGTNGLGSESDTVTVNGATSAFSDTLEPTLSLATPAIPTTPIPSNASVFTSEVYDLYRDLFNRDPDTGGLNTYTTALANGQSIASIRAVLANSTETQLDLNTLYNEVFARNLDSSGDTTYTNFLANGSGLSAVQLLIGVSTEAQSQIQTLYQQVLNRQADPGGLTNAMGFLAGGGSLAGIRNIFAHSPEAANDLTVNVFEPAFSRLPDAAELAGMEDQLGAAGAAQGSVVPGKGFTTVTPNPGSQTLTAAASTPIEFDFSNVSFGNDTINGFDPRLDAILLPQSLAGSFTDASNGSGSTSISFANDAGQSILLSGVPIDRFGSANFRFVPVA